MLITFGNVYRQAMFVLDSSPSTLLGLEFSGRYSQTTQIGPIDQTGGYAYAVPRTESHVLRMTFSSVPVIWQSELRQEYQELGQALSEMTELEEGDEWKIDPPVYNIACFIAAELMANSFPAPSVFNHGPESVVFNWSNDNDNLYLTVSADKISALVSSPERIRRRIECSTNELMNPALALSSIRAAYSDFSKGPVLQLITGTIPDPQELVLVD
jgi:hypothetical protein